MKYEVPHMRLQDDWLAGLSHAVMREPAFEEACKRGGFASMGYKQGQVRVAGEPEGFYQLGGTLFLFEAELHFGVTDDQRAGGIVAVVKGRVRRNPPQGWGSAEDLALELEVIEPERGFGLSPRHKGEAPKVGEVWEWPSQGGDDPDTTAMVVGLCGHDSIIIMGDGSRFDRSLGPQASSTWVDADGRMSGVVLPWPPRGGRKVRNADGSAVLP